MDESRDLIQEANIIPVISVDSGTPLDERPDISINLGSFQKHKTDEFKSDDKSDISNLLETSHKVFEKLTGSLTALGKSLRHSLSKDNEEDLEIVEEASLEHDIDVLGSSPGNKYVATWSSESGVLAVFPVDSKYGVMSSIFGVKTPFSKKNLTPEHKIYLSVSEDGQFVAISRIIVLKEIHAESPNMDAANSENVESTPESSFVVYSTKTCKKQDETLYSFEILGPLIFISPNTLVCFTKKFMHLFSTKFWVIRNSIQIDALIHSFPNYSNNGNECLVNVFDILIESLKYGYLIWPEERSGLSIWNTKGILKQWFYVEARNISFSRNLFAISSKGDLVARFHEEKRDKSGHLSIFHTPTALAVSDMEVPKGTFYISFLNKTDQIILCSREGEGVRVQWWDCWAGLLVFEEQRTYLYNNKPLLLIEDKFIQAVGNELCTYSLFPNNSSVVVEALTRTSSGCRTDENNLMIFSTIERKYGSSLCWGHIASGDNDLLCKFKFEPWHNWNNNEIFVHWLDSDGKRFIMAGKDSVQVYKVKPKNNQKYLNVDLQYIWISKFEDEIKLVTLETREESLKKTLLHVQLTNNEMTTLYLPEEDEKITYRVVSDACTAIHFLRLQYMDDLHYLNHLVLGNQLKKLIESSIQLFPTAFNKISLNDDEYCHPVEDFILLGWDDIVRSIIESDKYIPLFHNEEQSESVLLLLVELQKSDLVELMVNYIIRHMKQRHGWNRSTNSNFNLTKKVVQQPGFAWTVGKTLLDLYKFYPDKGVYIMKESSYFTTSLEAPTRILQTKLGNPFIGEERSVYNELKGVTRKARLPKSSDKILDKGFFKSMFDKYFSRRNSYDSRTRSDTGALVYYDLSHYPEKRQNMNNLSYGIRKKQRKQRLEDAKKTHPAKLCVVPWPDFCVYPPLRKKREPLSIFDRLVRFWNLYVSPVQRSPFAEVALNGTSEMFGEVAMEAIVKFKWDKFARRLFLYNFGVYLVHMILFCTIVSIESDLVPSNGKLIGWKSSLFIIESIIPMWLLIQEFRQMSGRWKNYWSSFFNYLDLASFGLPLACTLMVIMKQEPPVGLKSYAVLCVWINGLLQARAFAGPGKFIAIVLEIVKKIATLLLTLCIIIFGFANALFVLLRDEDPMSIVPSYNGTLYNDNGDPIGNVQMNQEPQSNTNMWTTIENSILATYFFLGIGWDSVTTIDPNVPLYLMMVLFSFFAVIILLNILIGLITEVFSGSLQGGRQAWLRQRAELIAELELFALSPSHRKHPDWFPHLIYYEAHFDAIKNWRRKLYVEEMGELDADFVKKELKAVRDDLNDEIKELKGMVGQIRRSMKSPIGGSGISESRSHKPHLDRDRESVVSV